MTNSDCQEKGDNYIEIYSLIIHSHACCSEWTFIRVWNGISTKRFTPKRWGLLLQQHWLAEMHVVVHRLQLRDWMVWANLKCDFLNVIWLQSWASQSTMMYEQSCHRGRKTDGKNEFNIWMYSWLCDITSSMEQIMVQHTWTVGLLVK